LVFAAILDFGRVAGGFHYPTDVLGGAAIGGLWDRMLDAVLGRVRPPGVAHPRSG
jgi:membrane-associated phospholipid phosphatase